MLYIFFFSCKCIVLHILLPFPHYSVVKTECESYLMLMFFSVSFLNGIDIYNTLIQETNEYVQS